MIDEESVEEWVARHCPLLQLDVTTSKREPCVLDEVLLSSFIEDLAKQDALIVAMSQGTGVSKARRWIWLHTESMSEVSLLALIVRIAWLFHPHVFSRTYREQFVQAAFRWLQRSFRETERSYCRQQCHQGLPLSAFEEEAQVPADDDVLDAFSSDDDS